MNPSSEKPEENSNREIEYYKNQVNELSKSIIDLQYCIAGMTHEIHQMRNGLKLIADLRDIYSFSNNFENVYDYFTESILIQMQLDRAFVLKPEKNKLVFYPFHCKGFSEIEKSNIENTFINFEKTFVLSKTSLLINSKSNQTELTREIRDAYKVNYFILVPVVFEQKVISYLFAGRNYEVVPLASSRLLQHDLQTIEAIAGIISTLKKQFDEINIIEAERSRIAKELHDDIGSELTTIRILSQKLIQNFDQNDDTGKKLMRISEGGKNVLNSVSEIIWSMNHRNDNLESLCAYIRRYAADFLELKGIEHKMDFSELFPEVLIHDNFRRNIFLVIKEALNNIVKHSEATEVQISMKYELAQLKICLTDNGIGIEEKHHLGNGLENMKQRIADIGGHLETFSKRGKTTVKFEISLA